MYDEQLADRIRLALGGRPFSERKMFGGLAFLIGGNMACGIFRDDLMVRTGAAGNAEALSKPHARPMEFTGRRMGGMVLVGPAGCKGSSLDDWVALGARYAEALPAKSPGTTRRAPRFPRRTVR